MAAGYSEYDPIPRRAPLSGEPSDFERVQALFEKAATGHLRTPWSWWTWSLLLPSAALLTRSVFPSAGALATLVLWSVVILVGGFVEAALVLRGRELRGSTPLGGWVLRAQGNLSLVAVALSALLLWQDLPQFVPAIWLLLIGHSFYAVGKLTLAALRTAGVLFQVGGLAALLPALDGLVVFAVFSFAGCVWIGLGVRRSQRQEGR